MDYKGKIVFNVEHQPTYGSIDVEIDFDYTLATTIINNSKVQLDAIKVTKGLGSQAKLFGVQSAEGQPQIGSKSLYDYKMEFAIYKNFKNVGECIAELGGNTHFEIKFKQWCKDNNIDLSKVQSE